jgi:predicted ester cyclase
MSDLIETTESNKARVRAFVEGVINEGRTDLLANLIAPDHVGHFLEGDHYGPDGVRIEIDEFRAGFDDLRVTIETLISEGDWVARRFTLHGTHSGPFLGLLPTGRQVSVCGLALDRFAKDQLIESWVRLDILGLLRQIGATVHDAGE